MSGNKPIYYWDACIYTAWLYQEEAYKEWLPSINTIAQDNKELENVIITSVITLLEVLNLDDAKNRSFHDSFYYGVNQLIEVERPIIEKAKQYREWYPTVRTDNKVLETPDAIHLASAAIYSASEFHTFDDGGKRGCSLLKLNGNVMGDNLKIQRPTVLQPQFQLGINNPHTS